MKILVLDVPALNLGYLGCYGNEWVATPNLDLLASESIVFDRHFADRPDLVSLAAQTGRHAFPPPNGTIAGPTIGAILDEHGIPLHHIDDPRKAPALLRKSKSCLVWAEFRPLAPPWDLPEEIFETYFPEEDQNPPPDEVSDQSSPHAPHEFSDNPWPDPPVGPLENPNDLPRLRNTYAAVVTNWDGCLGELLDKMRGRKGFDDILLILTGSGFPLGEHGYVGFHRPDLHEEAVHLPLLMRLPGGTEAGLRLPALTQPIDLFPTLLNGLNIQAPECHGQNLWPLIRGQVDQVRPYACSGLQIADKAAWALRSPDWALLLPVATAPTDPDPSPKLFIKPADRWEVNEVRQHNLEMADQLEKTLLAFVDASRKSGPLEYPPLEVG